MSDKCVHCGSDFRQEECVPHGLCQLYTKHWKCGSWSSSDGTKNQVDRCRILQLKRRLSAVRELLETAVCTKEPDEGVILLSHDGPTHREEVQCEPCAGTGGGGRPDKPCFRCKGKGTHGMSVYDHHYFSPLGDALIAAWKLTKIE